MAAPLRACMLLALALLATRVCFAQGACPAPATISVWCDNLSADASVTLALDGHLSDASATCGDVGATSYSTSCTCSGSGLVACGHVSTLRPGGWVNRVTLTVSGSEPQVQTQTGVFIGGAVTEVANTLVWTVYPRTIVVATATQAALDAAFEAVSGELSPALIRFARGAFPDRDHPGMIVLPDRNCEQPDGRNAGLCITASRVVVDALDDDAQPGAVVLMLGNSGKLNTRLVRVYGSDVTLRGLRLQGSADLKPQFQADTLSVTAPAARVRIERSIIIGPTKGDAVGVESGAAGVVVDACEIAGARDKGVKADGRDGDAEVTVQGSCVHDNHNGGLQATFGGRVTAVENLVEHNVPGGAQHGIFATGGGTRPSTLVTNGNIVRFAGARGLSVTNDAVGIFNNDYVADNQFSGTTTETTAEGAVAQASFRGIALACNHNVVVPRACHLANGDIGDECVTDADCCGPPAECCVTDPVCDKPPRCVKSSASKGYGAVMQIEPTCPTCTTPAVDYGNASSSGANAFTQNPNPLLGMSGVNFSQQLENAVVPAEGNQWEHCTTASCEPTSVAADLLAPDRVDLGALAGPRTGSPVIHRISPSRARRGELVRIYGQNFNAIDGVACSDETKPVDPCDGANAAVVRQNATSYGNLVELSMGGETVSADVVAVTPTMLVFTMPSDCFAPTMVRVSRLNDAGTRVADSIRFCDPSGCEHEPPGAPCDDGNPCTTGDHCDGNGGCVAAARATCTGPCLTGVCRPDGSCEPKPATAACDDGNVCTVNDHCSGAGDRCLPGTTLACVDDDHCSVDGCDPRLACTHAQQAPTRPDGVTCSADNVRAILTDPPDPACAGSCGRRLRRLVDEIARRIGDAGGASSMRGCRRALTAALRTATDLVRRTKTLAAHHRVTPPERAARLAAEAKRLRDRVRILAQGFCRTIAPSTGSKR